MSNEEALVSGWPLKDEDLVPVYSLTRGLQINELSDEDLHAQILADFKRLEPSELEIGLVSYLIENRSAR